MILSSRERFLAYVRCKSGARPVISPFLPHPDVVTATLRSLGLPTKKDDFIANEIRLAQVLEYEPMFMTDCHGLIFPWKLEDHRSNEEWMIYTLRTASREWVRKISRSLGEWGDESGFPVKTEEDHQLLNEASAMVAERETTLRQYFREWRERVGEEGVIVIGHPHVTWLAYQISQTNLVFHDLDYPETFQRSMQAIYEAALFVFEIAIQEGIDFMSESTYGSEMSSPARFDRQDLPYLQRLSDWTHQRGGLFWYHNCGITRNLILSGRFNLFHPDVLETLAPPPEGDNNLGESRRSLSPEICSKGNLDLHILRDGSVAEVERATRQMVAAVRGYRHIYSTADAVLPGTPPENLIAFIRTVQEYV
jgi:uroporphyrinogen-III decarboxylase